MTKYKDLHEGLGVAAWAYFFLYFNLNVGRLNLLPTFVGYLMFLSVIGLLEGEEKELNLLRPLAMILAAWHGLDWVLRILGIDLNGPQFIDLILDMANLYFHFQLLTNLASIAVRHQPDDCEFDQKLLKYRTLQTLMITAIWILTYFDHWFGDYWGLISGGMGVMYVIAGVCLMRAIFGLRRSLPEE